MRKRRTGSDCVAHAVHIIAIAIVLVCLFGLHVDVCASGSVARADLVDMAGKA